MPVNSTAITHVDEIAEIINMARSANGRHTQLSRVAMYAHDKPYRRCIATVRGEVFEPCELELQAVTDVKAILQPVPAGFDEEEDRLLVEAYMYVIDNIWLLVSNHLEEMTGHFHDPPDYADRFAHL